MKDNFGINLILYARRVLIYSPRHSTNFSWNISAYNNFLKSIGRLISHLVSLWTSVSSLLNWCSWSLIVEVLFLSKTISASILSKSNFLKICLKMAANFVRIAASKIRQGNIYIWTFMTQQFLKDHTVHIIPLTLHREDRKGVKR